MIWLFIGIGAGVMLVLALAMTIVLGRAHKAWHVTENPVVEQIQHALAGLDCGACGYPTCNQYAHAIVETQDPIDRCRPGGEASATAIAEILGVEAPTVGAMYAVVHCGANGEQRLGATPYLGEQTCASANLVSPIQACVYGCLGLGDCQVSCPFDAIHIVDGLAVVDCDKCTACGACVKACPRGIISIEPFKADLTLVVACSNRDGGKETRAACKVGCIACGLCAKACDLFKIENNLSSLDYQRYDPAAHGEALRAASGKCPTKCLPFRGKGEKHPPAPKAEATVVQ